MHIERLSLPAPLQLDATARAEFAARGYLLLRGLVPAAELPALLELHATLLGHLGEEAGIVLDWPSRQALWLAGTLARRNAHAAAAALMPGVELVRETMSLVPAGPGAALPWRQDEAMRPPGARWGAGLACLIALDGVGAEEGCPACLPGSHHGPLLAHAGTAAIVPEAGAALAVPLGPGDALLHHARLLHGAGPNRAGAPRRMLGFDFAVRERGRPGAAPGPAPNPRLPARLRQAWARGLGRLKG